MAGLGPWETNISVPHMKEPGNVIQTGNALWVDPYIAYNPRRDLNFDKERLQSKMSKIFFINLPVA